MCHKKILTIFSIIIIISFFNGCVDKTGTKTETDNYFNRDFKAPVDISSFYCTKDVNQLLISFTLKDKDGLNTICDGYVEIYIYDKIDNLIFSDNFEVKSLDFNDLWESYEWSIPFSKIEKGFSSYGSGRATLIFNTINDETFIAEDNYVEIPSYTDEEVENITDMNYISNSFIIDETISKGSFSVKVIRAGIYERWERSQFNSYLRIDVEVMNIGNESASFYPTGIVIIDENNRQYENSYYGTLDLYSKLYPGIILEGFLLFDDVPINNTNFTLMFELGYDENYDYNLYSYDIILN